MAKPQNFQEWVAAVNPEHAPLLKRLRSLILEVEPGFEEGIKWGQPIYAIGGAIRCYLADHRDYVHLGFYNGASLPDPEGIVDGTGKRLRHIKVRSEDDPPPALLKQYVRASADLPPGASM